MKIEQIKSVNVLENSIKELSINPPVDLENSLENIKKDCIENLWFDIFDICKDLPVDTSKHQSRMIELVSMVQSGQNIKEIIQKEENENKYDFQKPYALIRNRFNESLTHFLNSSFEQMVKSLEEKKEFNLERIMSFIINNMFSSENKCCKCGKRLTVFEKNINTCKMDIPVIQETYIQVPSGNLIIGDWFRDNKNVLKELTEVKNTEVGKSLMGIDSYGAQYGDTYLSEFAQVLSAAEVNVATVFVGNTSPDIFQKGDSILSFDANGYDDDNAFNKQLKIDMPKWNKKGSICTDLWRATVIDEEILMNHLMTQYSKEETKEIVEEIKSGWTTVQAKVKPGKYKLTYSIKRGFIEKNSLGGINFKLELCES